MSKSKHSSHIVTAVLLVLLTAAGPWARASEKPAQDELFRVIPAESLFVVRLNNLEYTLSQMDMYLVGVSPVPMGTQMMVRMQLAGLFGSPELTGVNMGGSFAAFGALMPGKSTETEQLPKVFVAGLVPVTDYEKFISGNPNCGEPDNNGISKITISTPKPPQLDKEETLDTKQAKPIMLAIQVGNYALLCPVNHYDQLLRHKKLMGIGTSASAEAAPLAGVLDAAEAKQAAKEPLWAYGNVKLASKTFGPILFGKLEEAKKMFEVMNESGQSPMANMTAIMDMYAAILETLMKETRALSIALNPKPNVLHFSSTISAIPGTTMADMFTEDEPLKEENKLLVYLEDGAAMNVSAKLTGKLNAKSMDFFAIMFGKDMTAEDKAKIKALAADIADVFDGVDAMTLSVDPNSKPPFTVKYVIEIDDKQKFDELIDKSAELFKTTGIADFYKKLGIEISFTIKRNVGTYKGVSIDSANLIMKSTEPNAPSGKMIDALYSGGFDYRWGIVDGLCVIAIGSEPDSMIRKMIDQVKAGGPKEICSEVKAALELLPQADKADLVGTYNYVRLLRVVGAMMQGISAPNMVMPKINIPSKSNINFAGKIGSDKMTLDIALPKQHLTEMMSVFQMLMQQQMQQQMKMQKPGTMPGQICE